MPERVFLVEWYGGSVERMDYHWEQTLNDPNMVVVSIHNMPARNWARFWLRNPPRPKYPTIEEALEAVRNG